MPRVRRRPTAGAVVRPGRAVAVVVLIGALLGGSAVPTAAQETDDVGPAAAARRAGDAWLAGARSPDGGFAVGGLPLRETPEAVLAHSGESQTSDVWSAREALDGVEALGGRDGGPTVLQAVAEVARSIQAPADAAVLITRVALPLGLDPVAFDPANESRPVDLVALLDGASVEDPVAAQAEVITARVALGEDAPPDLVTAVSEASRADGTWGATTGADSADPSTTGGAVTALIAAGIPPSDERVAPGLRALAESQQEDGGWGPETTATTAVMSTLRAAGYDPDATCWQEDLLGAPTGRPTPSQHLFDTQTEAGHWGSGQEALSTATAVQVLGDRWLPLTRADARSCDDGLSWPLPAVPPALLVVVGIGVVGVFGAVRILRGGEPGF